MGVTIMVRCFDGVVRHRTPFTSDIDAETWAYWGHICVIHHTYESTPGPEATTEQETGS